MASWIRGRDHFLNTGSTVSPLWESIEELVEKETGSKPFDDHTLRDNVSEDYEPSTVAKSRYDIVEGHSRYTRERVSIPSDLPLGPVELDLLSFSSSPSPLLLVLLGGMGSGKTTTIRYMRENFWKDSILCEFDSDPVLRQSVQSNSIESAVVGGLSRYISTGVNNLISPSEEITELWTWALSNSPGSHPAKNILSEAQNKLRLALGDEWREESDIAIKVRKEALAELEQNPFDNLHYQALRVDYYLTCRCSNDRSKFLLILDNADPLPPQVQTVIVRFVSSFQLASRCKVLVAIRPLTYSSTCQGANRLIDVVEHVGPSIIEVLSRRVERRILGSKLGSLSVRLSEDGRTFRWIKESEAKQWVEDILRTIRDTKPLGQVGDPNAKAFIEGICGHSIRSALVVAPKIFGSPISPPLQVVEAGSQRPKIRDHEIIRSIVEGWQGFYCARAGRVTDNIFDLGSSDSRSCTSKIRLLKKLKASGSLACLGEVRQHLSCFGYQEKLILDTVNSVLVKVKLLAWSDSVPTYEKLDGYQMSRLQLSKAGEYYIDNAMFNLEYVQGVHVDVLLPREETYRHDQRSFSDRLRSLELFVRFLHRQDLDEVKRMMLNPQEDYIDIYGETLFSLEIIDALERQIKNIANSFLRSGRTGKERREDVINTVERWSSFAITAKRESSPVVEKISSLRPLGLRNR